MSDCTLRASVTTGLEFLAAEEIKEKLGINVVEEGRGYIMWQNSLSSVTKALEMRIIDHLEVIMSKFTMDLKDVPETESLEKMVDILPDVDWKKGLEVWSKFTSFPHPVSPLSISDQVIPDNEDDVIPLPRYRATCYRTGHDHLFGSQDVSHKLGGLIQDRFKWPVNLTQYDIEVVISIVDDDITFGIGLTRKSLYHRNIEQFGRSTLKSNISAAMIRLAAVKSGDVVIDPMCGSGSITLEGATAHPEAFHLAGDNQEYCVQCSMNNIMSLNDKQQTEGLPRLNAGAIQWDATNLPLVTKSVDAIITDLPFGKRHSNKIDIRKLYPSFLIEAARVTKPETGRAVLLTSDRNLMKRVLPQVHAWWVVPRTTIIFHGGIRACIYLLRRTGKPW